MGRVDVEEMRRRDGSETASPDYDDIERFGIGMGGRILASRYLVQRVADVAADIVEREGGRERVGAAMGVSHFSLDVLPGNGLRWCELLHKPRTVHGSEAKSAAADRGAGTPATCANPHP